MTGLCRTTCNILIQTMLLNNVIKLHTALFAIPLCYNILTKHKYHGTFCPNFPTCILFQKSTKALKPSCLIFKLDIRFLPILFSVCKFHVVVWYNYFTQWIDWMLRLKLLCLTSLGEWDALVYSWMMGNESCFYFYTTICVFFGGYSLQTVGQ